MEKVTVRIRKTENGFTATKNNVPVFGWIGPDANRVFEKLKSKGGKNASN